MKEVDENVKMQRISRLLEMGGTMLAQSHDCGAPMFRYRGKVMCPVCDTGTDAGKEEQVGKEEPKRVSGETPVRAKPKEARKGGVKEGELTPPSSISDDNSMIAEMTGTKIREIAGSLENETDLHRIKEKLECIELGIRILKMLEP